MGAWVDDDMSRKDRMIITNPETQKTMKCKFMENTTFERFANGPFFVNATTIKGPCMIARYNFFLVEEFCERTDTTKQKMHYV